MLMQSTNTSLIIPPMEPVQILYTSKSGEEIKMVERTSLGLVKEKDRRGTLGEPTDLISICESLGVSPQDAASALGSEAPVRSLDERAFDDEDGATLGSMLAKEDEERERFDKLALKLAIEGLDEHRRRLIILRYFRDYSQAECAAALGLSQVKVSREEKKMMEILRRSMV